MASAEDARRVADKIAVRDVLYRYAFGIDRRDWALFRSCFGDEVEIDLSSWNGSPPSRMSADAWVEGVRAGLSGFDATQHLTANHLVSTRGDRAHCTSDVQASHALGDRRVVLGGFYETGLERSADGFRIVSSRLEVTWRAGDEALFAEAADRHGQRGG